MTTTLNPNATAQMVTSGSLPTVELKLLKRSEPVFKSDAERQTALRDETDRLNRNALINLIADYKLWIKLKDLDQWRATVRELGDIQGVAFGMTIIATNGILGYFIIGDKVFCGHIQFFTGKIKPLYSMPKEDKPKVKKPRKKSKRQMIIDSI